MGQHPSKNDFDSLKTTADVVLEQTESLAKVGYWELDLDYKKMTWSDGFFRISGYEPGELDADFQTAINVIHPDDRDIAIETINKAKTSGGDYSIQQRFITKNGRIKRIRSVVKRVDDSTGKPQKLVGIFHDITDNVEIQEQHEKTYDLYEYINKITNNAVYDWDVENDVFHWGDGFYRLLGYSHLQKPFTLADWAKLEHPADYEKDHQKRVDFLSDPQKTRWVNETRVQRADGSYIYVEEVGHLIRNSKGNPIRMIGVLRDLSTTKELLKSNERFNKVAEATNDAIWDYDVSSEQLWWGIGFYTLFGHDPEVVQPSMEKLMMLIHPEDRERVGRRIQEYMSDGRSVNWYEEYKFRKSNGEYAFVIDRAIFIRNAEGHVIRVVGAMTDITYRKIYEESLLELNNQLETSNSELEQFAYVASHDLQEPLRMVSSFLNLLEKKYGDVFDDKARQYIHFARDGAVRMRQIILDLLDFSRVGKHSEMRKNVDLNEVMKDVLALHRKQIEEKSAHIHVSPLPVLNTFRSPVLQVFQNLVGNALKYAKPDGNVVIHVGCTEYDDQWEFSVADNGIGIDPVDHQRIFIIFQRLHARDAYSGTGMGLAIVKKILDDLGGHIRVDSQLEKGSTFTFSIPKKHP